MTPPLPTRQRPGTLSAPSRSGTAAPPQRTVASSRGRAGTNTGAWEPTVASTSAACVATGIEPHADGQCGQPATHTVVRLAAGTLMQRPTCDDCGHPDEIEGWDREWSADRDPVTDSGQTQKAIGGWLVID